MPPTETLSNLYEIIGKIGEGTCGHVSKGRNKLTGQIVALKRIKHISEEQGFPPNSLTEIQILRKISHPNLVKLIQLCREEMDIYLVFEYFEFDLFGILYHSKIPSISFDQVRSYSYQLLKGIEALHSKKIIHRDLKPANLLISKNNLLQITDFGLACEKAENKKMTNQVITIWYRPPELLLGKETYGCEIDIWSVGCIIYEMITRNTLFRAMMDNEIEQLKAIFSVCGLPNPEWELWSHYPNAKMFLSDKKYQKKSLERHLHKFLPNEYQPMIPILCGMLEIDPSKRITATNALSNLFFQNHPDKLDPNNLPQIKVQENHQNLSFPKTTKTLIEEEPTNSRKPLLKL